MKTLTKLLIFFFISTGTLTFAQTAKVKGIIKNKSGQPIENVHIKYLKKGVTSDGNGAYSIQIPANENVILTFTHIAYKTLTKRVKLNKNKILYYSPKLATKTEEIKEVIVKDRKKDAEGIVTVTVDKAKKIAAPNPGIESVLTTFAGVNSNNELSTQYNVRGGNYDENLVYVNGIEVYRPFLIRSGQQEGLSFVNIDLTEKVHFSAGGFQAKYGDKMASVLDITYRKPTTFAATANLNLLGASAAVEGLLFKDKLAAIVGVRYRNNSLLVNSKDIETNFKPTFADVQTYLSYTFNPKVSLDFLGNFSSNNYNYTPISRRTRFGTINNPLELIVYYDGNEQDNYQTLFGALKLNYQASENLSFNIISSAYNTQEEEYFDIKASYNLGEPNTDAADVSYGDVEFSEGIGSQINHARNGLDALITNLQFKAKYLKNGHQFMVGAKYQIEDIRDQLIEWEVIDSAGFAIRPPDHIPNEQPYEPFTGPILPFQNIRAKNNTQINRISGFAQWSKRSQLGASKVWYNLGVRAHNWTVTGDGFTTKNQTIVSPRAQFAIKPDWEKDILFRFATGLYYQPPFYKELRNFNGDVQPNVKAQNALHIIAGMDYSFDMWNRPFKMVSEVYYKDFKDVNTYIVDNVRVRYTANNNAVAYAYGFDFRLNGEFVPGTESWVSFGYLKTAENTAQQGYIARPTDQRLKFGVLFQDYIPTIPNVKMYLNMVFNTGVPGGAPAYADPYKFQNRLDAYKRADVGMSYVLKDASKHSNAAWLTNFKEFSLGIELFNMFDVKNAITNTWVRDVYSKRQYAIPNYMTGRILNLKLNMKL